MILCGMAETRVDTLRDLSIVTADESLLEELTAIRVEFSRDLHPELGEAEVRELARGGAGSAGA